MRKISGLALAVIVVCLVSAVDVSVSGDDEASVSVGTKKGDWIEYAMNITGPPVPEANNITWYRCDVLEVNGDSILVNKTGLMSNGTLQSSLWDFNLSEGQVFGWSIIPADLGVGDQFFDIMKGGNVTIAGEEQKTVLGATRTVTHGSDERIYKEWDKATGFYIHAVEHTADYTIITDAVATNMWSPTAPWLNPVILVLLAAATALAAAIVGFAFLVKKKMGKRVSTTAFFSTCILNASYPILR